MTWQTPTKEFSLSAKTLLTEAPTAAGKWLILLRTCSRQNRSDAKDRNFVHVHTTPAPCPLRDLWRHEELGNYTGNFSATVQSHSVVAILLRQLPLTVPALSERLRAYDRKLRCGELPESPDHRGLREELLP